MPLVGAWGLGGLHAPGPLPPGVAVPAAGSAKTDAGTGPTEGVDYSGTNVQEQGVDEPDSVKTNGKTLFAVAGNRLNAVDVTGSHPKLLDSLKLDTGWSHELLLVGDHLLVLSRGGYWLTPLPAQTALALPFYPATSAISEIDISNPKALRVVNTLTLSGGYVDARLVGSSARIVVSSQVPTKLPFVTPTESTDAALATARDQNRAVVQSSRVGSWLPTYTIKRAGHTATAARPLVQCRSVDRPRKFSGLGMLTVLTVDLAKGLAPGRLDRRDDRRADRLRLARATCTSRPSAGPSGRCPRRRRSRSSRTSPPPSTASTSPTPTARATAAAARCRATC